MLYFLCYEPAATPRRFFTDLDQARSVRDYYRHQGKPEAHLRVFNADELDALAVEWLDVWGSNTPDIQEQVERQAQQIRDHANQLRDKGRVSAAVACPTFVRRGAKHDEYLNTALFRG